MARGVNMSNFFGAGQDFYDERATHDPLKMQIIQNLNSTNIPYLLQKSLGQRAQQSFDNASLLWSCYAARSGPHGPISAERDQKATLDWIWLQRGP